MKKSIFKLFKVVFFVTFFVSLFINAEPQYYAVKLNESISKLESIGINLPILDSEIDHSLEFKLAEISCKTELGVCLSSDDLDIIKSFQDKLEITTNSLIQRIDKTIEILKYAGNNKSLLRERRRILSILADTLEEIKKHAEYKELTPDKYREYVDTATYNSELQTDIGECFELLEIIREHYKPESIINRFKNGDQYYIDNPLIVVVFGSETEHISEVYSFPESMQSDSIFNDFGVNDFDGTDIPLTTFGKISKFVTSGAIVFISLAGAVKFVTNSHSNEVVYVSDFKKLITERHYRDPSAIEVFGLNIPFFVFKVHLTLSFIRSFKKICSRETSIAEALKGIKGFAKESIKNYIRTSIIVIMGNSVFKSYCMSVVDNLEPLRAVSDDGYEIAFYNNEEFELCTLEPDESGERRCVKINMDYLRNPLDLPIEITCVKTDIDSFEYKSNPRNEEDFNFAKEIIAEYCNPETEEGFIHSSKMIIDLIGKPDFLFSDSVDNIILNETSLLEVYNKYIKMLDIDPTMVSISWDCSDTDDCYPHVDHLKSESEILVPLFYRDSNYINFLGKRVVAHELAHVAQFNSWEKLKKLLIYFESFSNNFEYGFKVNMEVNADLIAYFISGKLFNLFDLDYLKWMNGGEDPFDFYYITCDERFFSRVNLHPANLERISYIEQFIAVIEYMKKYLTQAQAVQTQD